jgi:Mg2+/citrate symporter
MSPYALYTLIVTVVVMLGIAVFILLFERQRARQIERDLRQDDPRKTRDNAADRVTRRHDRGTEH